MNYEQQTLFTKEEVAQANVMAALQTGFFTSRPVVRNFVVGEQAKSRNTQMRFPLREEYGFDLFFRITPKETSYKQNSGGEIALDSTGSGAIMPTHCGQDFDEVQKVTKVKFASAEAALEAVASLHQDHELTPHFYSASGLRNVTEIVDYFFSFQQVFGRFPRDSEKVKLHQVSHIIYSMALDTETTKYPMKILQKYDHFRSLFFDNEDSQMSEAERFISEYAPQDLDGGFYNAYFRMSCKFVNFDTVMTKLERVLHDYAEQQYNESSTTQESTTPDPYGAIHIRSVKTIAQIKREAFLDIAHHVVRPFTVKAESFFMKYYKQGRLHTLLDLCNMVEEPDFPQSGNWAVFTDYMLRNAARKQLVEVKLRLQDKKFVWEDLKVDLPMTSVTHEGTTVRMLEAQDTTAFMLGDLTHCCQRLNGAGESCMFEGLVNPLSGFLVFERDNQIIAQAWVWQTDKDQLVLDNIEFANFKGVSSIKGALHKWLEASPFEDIQVGQSYMEIQFKGEKVSSQEQRWYKQTVWAKSLYTDASSRKWLKRDGIITL